MSEVENNIYIAYNKTRTLLENYDMQKPIYYKIKELQRDLIRAYYELTGETLQQSKGEQHG